MRSLSLLALLALACTPHEDMASPTPTTPASTNPIEAEPTPVEAIAGAEWFLGFVSQTGIEHCPSDHDEQWLALRSTLGFIPTSGASLEPWMGKPVLARGQAIPAPAIELDVEPRPCPMMQMRSDWVNTPQGIRVDHGGHPAIDHFFVSSAEPLTSLTLRLEGEELVVEFSNPLPFALAELGMVVHYEGCYGKPGSTQIQRGAQPLAVGETRTERFPIVVEEPPPPGARKGGPSARVHLASTIVLEAASAPDTATLHVDLDAPVSAFGLALECPDKAK